MELGDRESTSDYYSESQEGLNYDRITTDGGRGLYNPYNRDYNGRGALTASIHGDENHGDYPPDALSPPSKLPQGDYRGLALKDRPPLRFQDLSEALDAMTNQTSQGEAWMKLPPDRRSIRMKSFAANFSHMLAKKKGLLNLLQQS